MTEINPTLLLLLIEAVVLLGIAQLVWLLLVWRSRRREQRAVNTLIEVVTADAEARGQRNSAAISAALGVKGEPLETHVNTVERAEKLVLQRMVLGWMRRDAAAVATLPEVVEGLVSVWRELLSSRGAATQPAPASAPADDEEKLQLRGQLLQAQEDRAIIDTEMSILRETMQRMLEEYAAMYQRGDGPENPSAQPTLGARLDSAANVEPHADETVEVEEQSAPTPAEPDMDLDAARPVPRAPPADEIRVVDRDRAEPLAAGNLSQQKSAKPVERQPPTDDAGSSDVHDFLDGLFDAEDPPAAGHGDGALLDGLHADDLFDVLETDGDTDEPTGEARSATAAAP